MTALDIIRRHCPDALPDYVESFAEGEPVLAGTMTTRIDAAVYLDGPSVDDRLTEETQRQVLTHDEIDAKLCRWK